MGKFSFEGFRHAGEHQAVSPAEQRNQLESEIGLLESDVESLGKGIEYSKRSLEEKEQSLRGELNMGSRSVLSEQISGARESLRRDEDKLAKARSELANKREKLASLGSE